MANTLLTLVMASAALGVASAALALSPITGGEGLCSIKVVVVSLQEVEATDEQMQPITVPAIKVDIKEANGANAGPSCTLAGTQNTYRICQPLTKVTLGDTIKALVGRSIGGGPFCIENIVRG